MYIYIYWPVTIYIYIYVFFCSIYLFVDALTQTDVVDLQVSKSAYHTSILKNLIAIVFPCRKSLSSHCCFPTIDLFGKFIETCKRIQIVVK